MNKFLQTLFNTLRWTWIVLSSSLRFLVNLSFLLAVVVVILIVYQPPVTVHKNTVLVLAPEGDLVEKPSIIYPMSRLLNRIAGMTEREETPLQDILDAIEHAARDERISALLLVPSRIRSAGLSQLREIGQALEQFKKSGKRVIAADDTFSQLHYYLASWADEIYLNPMGRIDLHGFGLYRLYFKQLLDRLKIRFYIFRVGKYKSALEPILRDNMSAEARQSNQLWLSQLWSIYCEDIGRQRNLRQKTIEDLINNQDTYLLKTGGDMAVMALHAGLVDGLKTRRQLETYLKKLTKAADGKGGDLQSLSFYDYLTTFSRSYTEDLEKKQRAVGIILAQGDIVCGQGRGDQIGSADLVRSIRRAGSDPHIGALVLRIDSGGGSALASELIRQELVQLQRSGKPVVVSMSSLAASGAYWLSADSDYIFASPATLTGSIGIFGAIPTLEETLAERGIHSDGTGTTTQAAGISLFRSLSPVAEKSIQLSVEQGYNRFLDVVSRGRKLPLDKVKKLAQGRVWDGISARRLGLIDDFGSLEDAVVKAAELADLPDPIGIYIDRADLPWHRYIPANWFNLSTDHALTKRFLPAPVREFRKILRLISSPADPDSIYAHSLLFPQTIAF